MVLYGRREVAPGTRELPGRRVRRVGECPVLHTVGTTLTANTDRGQLLVPVPRRVIAQRGVVLRICLVGNRLPVRSHGVTFRLAHRIARGSWHDMEREGKGQQAGTKRQIAAFNAKPSTPPPQRPP